MIDGGQDTVLLVCSDEIISNDILETLHNFGIGIVGPTSRAATALAMAAQTPPTVAVIASALTGRRSAAEFAEELMANWGIKSWILDSEPFDDVDGDTAPAWAVSGDQLDKLRRAFQAGRRQAA